MSGSRVHRFRMWCPASAGPGLAALLLLIAAACGRDSGSTRVVNIVTAPPGGSWYVMGGALASIINDAVPGVQAVAEVSGGAEENVRLVGTGQAILGFVISKTALQGYQGQAPFSQAFPNLRVGPRQPGESPGDLLSRLRFHVR
ncbi:MAG: hypothetical protein HYU37_07210 [Acidobacteria bacterium]|nr:hypothetical protein [Acidobacteriota bacterium]